MINLSVESDFHIIPRFRITVATHLAILIKNFLQYSILIPQKSILLKKKQLNACVLFKNVEICKTLRN